MILDNKQEDGLWSNESNYLLRLVIYALECWWRAGRHRRWISGRSGFFQAVLFPCAPRFIRHIVETCHNVLRSPAYKYVLSQGVVSQRCPVGWQPLPSVHKYVCGSECKMQHFKAPHVLVMSVTIQKHPICHLFYSGIRVMSCFLNAGKLAKLDLLPIGSPACWM